MNPPLALQWLVGISVVIVALTFVAFVIAVLIDMVRDWRKQ